MKIAYLTNLFPAPSERYVADEITELRRRGVEVLPCSVRRPAQPVDADLKSLAEETSYVQTIRLSVALRATWFCLINLWRLRDLLQRVLLQGSEDPLRRVRTLAHTWLGAYLAALIADENVEHIHVHHGYFGSWVAMIAARLLRVTFSMTLHGSDLLLHPSYLDTKLNQCSLCVTISDFNRRRLLANYPCLDPSKIVVRRMGVDCADSMIPVSRAKSYSPFALLSVGRLHPTKDHKFLLLACRLLKDNGTPFICRIAGEGEERPSLEKMIARLGLANEVKLLGHIPHQDLPNYYEAADLVVLTSRSEGIPLVLMEAMARRILVLAPAITGIPELIIHGHTGFLYHAGSLEDFTSQVDQIRRMHFALDAVRQAARKHVLEHFNREINLSAFCDLMIRHVAASPSKPRQIPMPVGANANEDLVLQ